jgi:hypothetical protein
VAGRFGYELLGDGGVGGTWSGTGSGGGLAELFERLIEAVERVAPGVGRQINGIGTAVTVAGRTR